MKLSAINLKDYTLLSHCCEADSRLYQKNFYMGRYLMYSDDFGEQTPKTALFHFKEAEKSDPSSIHNLIEIAKLYLKLKDKKKACEYAEKVLAAIPDDFMDNGFQRSFYLSRSAEALAILGKYKEAEERIQLALTGRKCDFCQYCGCIDAYSALVYMCCIQGDEAGAAKYRQLGLDVHPHDFDLLWYPDYFMKKRGIFK
jgi:tetratricopeptide (TPR) repeat protein